MYSNSSIQNVYNSFLLANRLKMLRKRLCKICRKLFYLTDESDFICDQCKESRSFYMLDNLNINDDWFKK